MGSLGSEDGGPHPSVQVWSKRFMQNPHPAGDVRVSLALSGEEPSVYTSIGEATSGGGVLDGVGAAG